jgi:hypothetical protein
MGEMSRLQTQVGPAIRPSRRFATDMNKVQATRVIGEIAK